MIRASIVLAIALCLGGCTVPRAAVGIRNDTAAAAYAESRSLSADIRKVFEPGLEKEAEGHYQNLRGQYYALLETADEGTSDPVTIAARGSYALRAYEAGLAKTRERMERRAAAFYALSARVESLGDAAVGINAMAERERSLTEDGIRELIKSGAMDSFLVILDTLEAKYQPAEVKPIAARGQE